MVFLVTAKSQGLGITPRVEDGSCGGRIYPSQPRVCSQIVLLAPSVALSRYKAYLQRSYTGKNTVRSTQLEINVTCFYQLGTSWLIPITKMS